MFAQTPDVERSIRSLARVGGSYSAASRHRLGTAIAEVTFLKRQESVALAVLSPVIYFPGVMTKMTTACVKTNFPLLGTRVTGDLSLCVFNCVYYQTADMLPPSV